MNFLKSISYIIFFGITISAFSQSDSSSVRSYFPVRSVLAEKVDYSVNMRLPKLENIDYAFDSYYRNFIQNNNYSYDGPRYTFGSPCEAAFIVATVYLLQTIDRKFFNKPEVKKKNLLLLDQY